MPLRGSQYLGQDRSSLPLSADEWNDCISILTPIPSGERGTSPLSFRTFTSVAESWLPSTTYLRLPSISSFSPGSLCLRASFTQQNLTVILGLAELSTEMISLWGFRFSGAS